MANITNRFGEEGINATFNHIALDRIAELIELGFGKEEIKESLLFGIKLLGSSVISTGADYVTLIMMITWMPNLDPQVYDPPCLQSLWFRILEDENGVYWLNSNIRFRSNDAWGANFMNMFGFVQFSREVIANEILLMKSEK